MGNAEDDEAGAVGGGVAVLAGAAGGGELKCSDNVLGSEVAGAEPIAAADDAGDFGQLDFGDAGSSLDCFGKRGANVAAERVVGAEGFVSALEDDDVLFAAEGFDDGGLRERADDIDVDGADGGAAGFAEIVDGGFNVFRSRAEGDEDGLGVVGLVFLTRP